MFAFNERINYFRPPTENNLERYRGIFNNIKEELKDRIKKYYETHRNAPINHTEALTLLIDYDRLAKINRNLAETITKSLKDWPTQAQRTEYHKYMTLSHHYFSNSIEYFSIVSALWVLALYGMKIFKDNNGEIFVGTIDEFQHHNYQIAEE